MSHASHTQPTREELLNAEVERLRIFQHAVAAIPRECARTQQYLDIADVMLVVLDHEGNITLLNRKGHEILDYPQGELLGEPWFETCLPAAEAAPARTKYQQIMAEKRPLAVRGESSLRTRCGRTRIMAWHHRLLTDEQGHVLGLLSSGSDVTEIRRTEAELQRVYAEVEELRRRIAQAPNRIQANWRKG